MRIAVSGDIATVLTTYRTPFEDFYTIRRIYDGAQFDVSSAQLRRNGTGEGASNVVAFPAREYAVQ
ncbi:MAG TPA: hypothetical protein VIO38_13320 [Rariglobus sp.]